MFWKKNSDEMALKEIWAIHVSPFLNGEKGITDEVTLQIVDILNRNPQLRCEVKTLLSPGSLQCYARGTAAVALLRQKLRGAGIQIDDEVQR